MPRILAAAPFAAFALLAAPQARADGLFGNLFSRVVAPEAPKQAAAPEQRDRDREARNMRREYWERERARLNQAATARPVANQAVASR